jgi:hypothetical protein
MRERFLERYCQFISFFYPLQDEAASLLYGDDSVVRMESPEIKNLNYVILKSPTQQFLMDSYRDNLWNTTPQIKKKLRELCQQNEVMAFVIINGSRHFHGYLMIENDKGEYDQLNEEEAKLKVSPRPSSLPQSFISHCVFDG